MANEQAQAVHRLSTDQERLDAGYVFTPNFRKEGSPPFVHKVGSCCAGVHCREISMHSYQCTKRAKVKRDVLWHGKPVSLEYCGLHDPVAVKAKREARSAKWKAESDAYQAKMNEDRRQKALATAAIAAIKEIANGHNDARGLALEVLRQNGELPS